MKIILVSQPDSRIGPETDRVSETEGSVDFWSIIAKIKGAAAEPSDRPRAETGSRFAGNINHMEEFADPALSEQRPAESSQKLGPESGVEVGQRQRSGSGRVREGVLFEGYMDVLTVPKSESAPAVALVAAPDSDSVTKDTDGRVLVPDRAAVDNLVPSSSNPVPTSSSNELWIENFPDDQVVHRDAGQDPSGSAVEAKDKDPLENVPRAIGPESQFQGPSKSSVPRPDSGRSEEVKSEWDAPPQAVRGRLQVDPASVRGEVADARSNDEFSNPQSAALRVKNHPGKIESGTASVHSRPAESNAESLGRLPRRSEESRFTLGMARGEKLRGRAWNHRGWTTTLLPVRNDRVRRSVQIPTGKTSLRMWFEDAMCDQNKGRCGSDRKWSQRLQQRVHGSKPPRSIRARREGHLLERGPFRRCLS